MHGQVPVVLDAGMRAVEVASNPEVQERAGQVVGAGVRMAQGVGASAAQV